MVNDIPVLAFVGRSNSGKTTLLEKLIPLLKGRGYRVGVVKHTTHRPIETDMPGTDTRRLWDVGAEHVTLAAFDRVVHTHRCAALPPLAEVLSGVRDVDLIVVEGYKFGALPKIEVIRAARDPQRIPDLEGCIACVTDVADLATDVPFFGLDDVEALAEFIIRTCLDPDA